MLLLAYILYLWPIGLMLCFYRPIMFCLEWMLTSRLFHALRATTPLVECLMSLTLVESRVNRALLLAVRSSEILCVFFENIYLC